MPLVILPNLYTVPSDIDDYLGAENVDLRLDDRNAATGQTITVTADAAPGATVLSITALWAPLLAGTQLKFAGSGMPAYLYVSLAAVARVGDTSLSVVPLTAAVPAQAQAIDSGVNLAQARRMVKGCSYGTARVKLYCCNRYDDSQLATAWSCNFWATVIASRWLCGRRGQQAAGNLADDYEEAMKELNSVRCNGLNIEDIGTRTSGWPFITNVTVDPTYTVAKTRVEPSISEATPTIYPQFVDWNSLFLLESW